MPDHEIEVHPYSNYAEQMALRERFRDPVTASVAAVLFDRHRWTTRYKQWLYASGVDFPFKNNSAAARGLFLEESIIKWLAEERPDLKVRRTNEYRRIAAIGLGGSPDCTVIDSAGNVGTAQLKTTTKDRFANDWDDGTFVPIDICDQIQTEALLMKAKFALCVVAVVDAYSVECHIIDMPIDPDLQAQIIERAQLFRADVEAGREPQPQFDKDAEVVKLLHPQEMKGKVVDLSGNNMLPHLLAERAQLGEKIKLDKARCDAIDTEIKFLMEDAERVAGIPGWKITWKVQLRKEHLVPASSPRVFLVTELRT